MSLSLFSSQGLAQLDIDITLNELAIAARRYVDELGLDAADVVRRTFRLVVRDVMSITAPNIFLMVSCAAKPMATAPVANKARTDLAVSGSIIETALTAPTKITATRITVPIMGTSTSSNLFSV